MRSIIRFSVSNEENSAFRNQLAKILTDAGYRLNPRRTATFENRNITEKELVDVMCQFWTATITPPNEAEIDHVWTYSDHPEG